MKDAMSYRTIHKSVAIIVGAYFLFCMPGCDSDPRVAPLQKQMQDLNKAVEDLKKDAESQKRDLDWAKFIQDSERIAYLTPGESGYSVIKMDFGTITVNLQDIKAYANGSRVTLKFGNPTSATLTDVSATLDWGTVDDKGAPRNDSEKTREIGFDKSLPAGRWTIVDFVLDGIPPTTLGFVRVHELKNKGIVLY
jgi:outer membrane murein-binding lipoprotein Lpp